MNVESGIDAVGRVEWGSHFCHFYETANDLAETLVPFFGAGIANNEACLWITAEPFGKDRAEAALNARVPDLPKRMANGQVRILHHSEWYERIGASTRGAVGGMWLNAKAEALDRGYCGLRLTGNTGFVPGAEFDAFLDYERALREAFRKQELIALCSYDASRCEAGAVLDVLQAHDFALARRKGDWQVVENASVARTKQALTALNCELEDRIAARTGELAEALAHQRLLTAELSHRVKNTIAGVHALVDRTLRGHTDIGPARAAVGGRLMAMARVHDRLAECGWKQVGLGELFRCVLTAHVDRLDLKVDGEWLAPRAAVDLALVLHELGSNAARHGALSGPGGRVAARAAVESEPSPRLVIDWTETGGAVLRKPSHTGFGTELVRRLISHNLRGECELDYRPSGLHCTIRLPAHETLASGSCCVHGGVH